MANKEEMKKIELTPDELDNVSGGAFTFAVCVKCRHLISGRKFRVESGWMCEKCKKEEDLQQQL